MRFWLFGFFLQRNCLTIFIKFHYTKSLYVRIVNLDALTYAGNLDNVSDIQESERYHFIKGDIGDKILVKQLFEQYHIDIVVNFAAESHVDRSILMRRTLHQ